MKAAILFFVLKFCSMLSNAYGQTACSTQNDIQLNTMGFSLNAGRVEICDCSNAADSSTCFWATVSAGSATQPWSWKNALVVCRQNGYNSVMNPILQNTIPTSMRASDSVNIYQSTFQCDGTETTLTDCMTSSLPDFSTHANDAYINCLASISTDIDVRLIGAIGDTTGVVEYYDGSSWLTICPTEWDDIDAGVVCRSLGFEGGTSATYVKDFEGPMINTQPSITFVQCVGTETEISACMSIPDSVCGQTTLAGVSCTESSLRAGSVRLFDDTSFYSRVEVLYAGRWGTVCGSSGWSLLDGRVACRELGFDTENTDISTAVVFSSTPPRPIWVSEYLCFSNESTLDSCSKENPIGYAPSCTHANDAGLTCGTSSTSSSGLSPGATSGIIFAVFFVVSIVIFIVIRDKHRKGQLLPWWRKQKQDLKNCFQSCIPEPRTQSQPAPREITLEANTTSQTTTQRQPRTSSSSSTSPAPPRVNSPPSTEAQAGSTAQPSAPSLENPELTKVEPPSYDDALRLQHVRPPPQYIPPDSDEKLPYPRTSGFIDPAYPPAPDYQGYPTPTFPTNVQPPPPGFIPGVSDPLPPPVSENYHPSAPPPFPEQSNLPYPY